MNTITMHIPRGAIYGFVGKNGAGKTPLTAISGYLELLEQEAHSAQTLRCLEIIRNRIAAMKQLTEELFGYSLMLPNTVQMTFVSH